MHAPEPVVLGTPADLRNSAKAGAKAKTTLKGRQATPDDLATVRALIGEPPDTDGYPRDELIEYLHRLNDAHRCLRKPHLVALAQLMRLSMVEVMEVATFYHHFDVLEADEVAPLLVVRSCDGLSCELAGGDAVAGSIRVREGVSIRRAPCIGQCDHAPAVAVGQRVVQAADAASIEVEIDRQIGFLTKNSPLVSESIGFVATKLGVIADSPEVDFDAYLAAGGYALWQATRSGERAPHDIIASLTDAGLRGLGGAGFGAGRKWGIVRDFVQRSGKPGLMVVNLDEGEPGTFKDRDCLSRDPHRMIEGMLIAAEVVGVERVYIYLRDEYHALRGMLQVELERMRARFADATSIVLRRGAGAYICGEESALIESLEGKRGEPRLRPPYIAQQGLFGRPTLAHNGETLAWVRDIVEHGPVFFSGHGRRGRTGLRRFSVSGRVARPGVKLAPAGISLQELIDEHCGGMLAGFELYGFLPGGASGGIFPASLADIALDFDTLQPLGGFIGSAAVIVLGKSATQTDWARDAALNMMRFFAHESCGQCTPCRVGTAKAAQLMTARSWDFDTLNDLNAVMADASICGLGQAAPNPVQCVQRYFADEVA